MALSLVHTICSSLQHVLILLSVLFVHRLLSGNGYRCRRSLNFRLHGFMSSLAVAYLTSLTNQFTPLYSLTPRLTAISHQPPTLLTAASRLFRNRSCFSLYNIATDRIENTSLNRPSIVASRIYSIERVQNTAFQLLYC
jgi:hypothetical protein